MTKNPFINEGKTNVYQSLIKEKVNLEGKKGLLKVYYSISYGKKKGVNLR